MDNIEIWKNIKYYEGTYYISNFGNIKSFQNNRGSLLKEKIKVKQIKSNGYENIPLYKYGKEKRFYIHRLVAQAFIINQDNKPQVNHINGIKTDNRVENLEWCTGSENILHAFKTGLKNSDNSYFKKNNPSKGKFGKKHFCAKIIFQYSLELKFIKKWDSIIDVTRELGINSGNISLCCNLKIKTAGGYIWKYKII